jgi:carbamoyl-phosphate synthase small subunit
LGDKLKPTHRSLFDGSLQGVARTDKVAFSFQGHPEASPGPHDLRGLFHEFIRVMENRLEAMGRVRVSAAAG